MGPSFSFNFLRQQFVRVHDAVRVEHLLYLLHVLDHFLGLRVLQEVRFLVSDAVLGAHAASGISHEVHHERLYHLVQLLLVQLIVVSRNRHIEMQIAIANVAVSSGEHAFFLRLREDVGVVDNSPGLFHYSVEVFGVQAYVVFQAVAVSDAGGCHILPQVPDLAHLGLSLWKNGVEREVRDALQELEQPLVVPALFAIACSFNDLIKWVLLASKNILANAKLLLNHSHRWPVHELARLQDIMQLQLRCLENGDHVLKGAAGDKHDTLGFWGWWTENGAFSDDSKRSLRANEKMLKIVASIIFSQGRDVIEDLASGQHRLQSNTIRM